MVWVYRTNTKKWEVKHRFISIDGEEFVIQLARGRRMFRSTCIKPHISSQINEADDPGGFAVVSELHVVEFSDARVTELRELVENGTFLPTPMSAIPPETMILGSRFIDEPKRVFNGGEEEDPFSSSKL